MVGGGGAHAKTINNNQSEICILRLFFSVPTVNEKGKKEKRKTRLMKGRYR